jgi:hypothetical protein
MMTATQRRALYRKLIRTLRLYQVWSGAELRDRPDALRERNEALIMSRRILDELLADHQEEVRKRLKIVPKVAEE